MPGVPVQRSHFMDVQKLIILLDPDRIKLLFIVTVLLVGSALGFGCQEQQEPWRLLVRDPRSGTVYYSENVEPGITVTLSYRHSVSNSMVYGTFMITDQAMIKPLTTSYTTFGPGLPMDSTEEYTIEEGIVTVHHLEEARASIRLWVSPQTGETLTIGDQLYPLYEPGEANRLIEIIIAK